jgi:hydrogenase maturation protein HypF
MTRLRLEIEGTVQGVGFRPFVYREATKRSLDGWVRNARGRVEVEVQGTEVELDQFVGALKTPPPPARVDTLERHPLPERPGQGFAIVPSEDTGAVSPSLPADLAPCADCVRELGDASDRRHGYPFTACTRCGPRYSVVVDLPYDRDATTLVAFPLCERCEREYRDPSDRRFHGEATACPDCGPKLSLFCADGKQTASGPAALERAASALAEGSIVALRGVGGFQLLCDARSEAAVRRLRTRKRREEKPFAVLFASLAAVRAHTLVSDAEAALLASPEAPIVLCERRTDAAEPVAEAVAPRNPRLGCMVPSSPLHHLLATRAGVPLVCTSGNVSGEPLALDDADARERLGAIADVFLSHDRAIARPLDDSVARVDELGPELLRRARGYAPRAVARLPRGDSVLALGAHLKATAALVVERDLVLGQHVGDLDDARALAAFERNVGELTRFFRVQPSVLVCDLHPDYASTRLAEQLAKSSGVPLVRVQHHHAHVAAVMAEHGLTGPVLGIAWDGTGLGSDGGIWGGEFLLVDALGSRRFAHFSAFPLPGGDAASRWPWRSAVALLSVAAPERLESIAERWLGPHELRSVAGALARGVNAPATTSVGRLFDGVAALLGLRARVSFEGQAAMELEFLASRETARTAPYALPLIDGPYALVGDVRPLVREILDDLARGTSRETIAARFHAALVAFALEIAERAERADVVLSGGCFQNRLLRTSLAEKLGARGHRVHVAREIPCNDGGISAGQAYAVALKRRAIA